MKYITIKEVIYLNKNFDILKNKFEEIRNMGWIKTLRKGSTGIGYTFEKLLDKEEDALCFPDYNGIEIKTHRKNSMSYVTLFNYNPIGESTYELKRLFYNYSFVHTINNNIRSLNADVYCGYIKHIGVDYKVSLDVDEDEQKVYLLVFDKNSKLIEKKSYWSFDTLKEKLYGKLKYLAFVEAESKFINGIEYFKYSSISFYTLRDFDTFIRLIKIAKVKVSFLISGSMDDDNNISSHGVSFSIKVENLKLLFRPIG